MTLEEFLQEVTIEYDLDGNPSYLENYEINLEDQSEITLHPNGKREYKKQQVKSIDIDNNQKTITIKH